MSRARRRDGPRTARGHGEQFSRPAGTIRWRPRVARRAANHSPHNPDAFGLPELPRRIWPQGNTNPSPRTQVVPAMPWPFGPTGPAYIDQEAVEARGESDAPCLRRSKSSRRGIPLLCILEYNAPPRAHATMARPVAPYLSLLAALQVRVPVLAHLQSFSDNPKGASRGRQAIEKALRFEWIAWTTDDGLTAPIASIHTASNPSAAAAGRSKREDSAIRKNNVHF